MPTLAIDVVCIAAALIHSNRRAKPSMDLSTPVASVMSHMSISFCKWPCDCNEQDTRHSGPTNRLIVPVLPILLHLRKSLLNHRSDKFNLLLNLDGEIRQHACSNANMGFY